MRRKWTVLAAMMASVALLATGISFAEDEQSPLAKVMEKVNKAHLTIQKGVRSQVGFKQNKAKVVASAGDLVKYSKEANEQKQYALKNAKEVKNPAEKWDSLMGDFVKEAESFSKEVSGDSVTQAQAKASYRGVSKRCSACHEVFRVEEEGF